MSGFDFATVQLQDAIHTLSVRHPATGDELATIDLISIESARPKAVRRAQEKKKVQARNLSRAFDPAAIEAEAIEQLVACTVGWKDVSWQGQVLECKPENVRMVYEKIAWLRDEVARVVNDPAFFLENSAKTSETSSGRTSN